MPLLISALLNQQRHFLRNPHILSSLFNSQAARQLHRIVFPHALSSLILFHTTDLPFRKRQPAPISYRNATTFAVIYDHVSAPAFLPQLLPFWVVRRSPLP